jgi:hypothetical protein
MVDRVQMPCNRSIPVSKAKTLDPGFRRDDGGNFSVVTTTTVIPAQAGIQRLSSFISAL